MKLLFAAAIAVLATGTAVAQERDARGIVVQSEPATPPPGVNQPVNIPAGAQVVVNPNQAAAFQTQPATAEYPPCTRGQTDRCVQTYEVGSRATRTRRPR